jgi:glycosyltransferase involved in cell wall biosynthesis
MVLILNLSNNLVGGGLQVALSILEECKKIKNHFYHVFLNEHAEKQVHTYTFSDNFIFYKIPCVKIWQLYKYLRPLEIKIKPDCVFTIFGPSYWRPKAPHVMGYAIPHYIYKDYSFFKHIPILSKIRIYLKKLIQLYLFKHQADHLVVQTKDAQQRLIKLIHTKEVSVVSNAYNSFYLRWGKYANKLPHRKSNEIRLITISKYYQHKNLESIPMVLDELDKININNIYFVLTLQDNDYDKIIPERVKPYVYNVGPVPVIECPSLYNECDILYLPTLLEVFSASYLEAMLMGKPILTSDLSFAKDICGDAALYFDPFNMHDIAETIKKISFDKNLYKIFVDKGMERVKLFPAAAQCTDMYFEICRKIVNEKSLRHNHSIIKV